MAKQTWNNPIDKTVDWGGDATTGNLPVSGEMVQRFIKESLNGKAGLFYYDSTNNRYLVFADADARDEYLLDPTQTELIIGTFDAPFNYTAEINLTSAAYNAVFLGSTGNYIDFTFDIKNKQGASTGENVTVTYTFIRNAVRQTVTETRKFGDAVHFNIDKYLGEGTNTIVVGVTGQTSLAATTVAITYQVVNLKIEDDLDIAKAYNLSGGTQLVEVPFTVSGYGTKVVEWYLDGEMLPFVKAEDEVVDVIATRTKNIPLANLQQGTHSLQIRAYSLVNGEKFYTDTLYRDIIVYTGANSNIIIGVAVTIPRAYGVLGAEDSVTIYDMVQYVPYTLRFATYSPSNAANTEVTITLDGSVKGVVNSSNGIENEFILTSTSSGDMVLNLSASGVSKDIATIVQETNMNIQEITSGLVLNFVASGKTNNSPDRDTWSDGTYTGTLAGFNWNNTSGWVGGRLEMNAGASFAIDLAPLDGSPTNTGKTIEIEWSTKNVTNDNAVICDLRGEDGVGILITATKVSMTSADGVVVETEYKSDENVRIGFVINKATGSTNKRLSFIYANGIISRAEQWSETDSYASDKTILFTASEEAEVSLKSIRIYDAALSSDNMLNNYTLYRDTIAEMMAVYDRNDVYEDGTVTFSPEKMMNRLPVMIVTGDIPTLENTSDKDTQIVVDIEYYNGDLSFTMKNAAMRPQGTSSMGYPKKNFRIYTQKVANTEVYDSTGKPIADKLYSFKNGAQPVNCWCLKADYAESSGTHNTGIARLWNEALYNAQINGEYKLRTEAQKKAAEAGYPYDVRTTIDGFPILLFYRPKANDDLIFIGKYNFNNDKSTESVFGFKGIPNFDNSKMQCWEVLNNGNALALFTSVDGFDEEWSEAFESRYPDTKTPYTGDLKAFCEWMTSVSQENFATEKWEHLDVYKMAAYWVYLMRHAAADQFVKNAMFTSEDGIKWYYILYDNDTINGLINTGHLRIKPTDDRNTVDESGSHVFAGYDSRLWNMLEADDEFKDIVSAVDNALYSAGISYVNTIKIFDEEQANKWVERVYNQDAQYKYVGPYVERGVDNLFMLQGKRDLHRRWWLAKRFSIYDAKYVSGTYKSQNIELKCLDETPAGLKFKITSGYPLDYGYGINNVPREFGVYLNSGESHTFETKETVFRGDPIRIYGAPHLAGLDLSLMSDKLAVVTLDKIYDESLGTKMTKLVVGNAQKVNLAVAEISGLKQASALEYLDIQGMTKMNSVDLSNHKYFKTLKAFGSGISSATFAKGAPVERLELPSSMRVLNLNQLPYLASGNIAFEDIANLAIINVTACPNVSNDFGFVYNWFTSKTTANKSCSLVMDNVMWENVDSELFLSLCDLKLGGGNLDLKGKVSIPNATIEVVNAINEIFGETAFLPDSELYIEIPESVILDGPSRVVNGKSGTFVATPIPVAITPPTYHMIVDGEEVNSIAGVATLDANTGVLSVNADLSEDAVLSVQAKFLGRDGVYIYSPIKEVAAVVEVRPTAISINGSDSLYYKDYEYTYHLGVTPNNVNIEYSVEWALSDDDNLAIIGQDNESCVIKVLNELTDSSRRYTIAAVLTSIDGGTVLIASKDITIEQVVRPTSLVFDDTNEEIQFVGDYTYVATPNITPVNVDVTYSTPTLSGTAVSEGKVSLVSASNGTIIIAVSAEVTSDLYFTIKQTAVVGGNGVTIEGVKQVTLKNVVRPTSITIEGNDTISGGNHTYTAVLSPSTANVPMTYVWSVSGSSNVSIQSTDGANCVIIADTPDNDEIFTISCVATTTDGKTTVNTMFSCTLQTKPSFIVATYDVASTTSATQLVWSSYNLANISYMEIDGVEVTPVRSYTFATTGMHEVVIKHISSTEYATSSLFRNCSKLYSLDFSSYNGVKCVSIREMCRDCSGLNTIEWGECTFNISSKNNLDYAFYGCSKLSYLSFSFLAGSSVTETPSSWLSNCSKLKDVDLTGIAESSLKTFRLERSLNSIDLKPLEGADKLIEFYLSENRIPRIDNIESLKKTGIKRLQLCISNSTNLDLNQLAGMGLEHISFTGSSITSMDLSPLKDEPINSLEYMFYKCSMESIDLTPFAGKKIKSVSYLCGSSGVKEIIGLDMIDLSECTNFSLMIERSSVRHLKFGNFSNSVCTTLREAFYLGYRLESIDFGSCAFTNVTSLSDTFYGCDYLTTIDLRAFEDSPISNLYNAFRGCTSLTSIDLSPLADTTISSMDGTFYGCISLQNIIAPWVQAPNVTSTTFGENSTSYTGVSYIGNNNNKLYCPIGATGYDSGYWLDTLLDKSKCDFSKRYINYEPTECVSLVITANDVSARATTTEITYSAITNGINTLTNESVTSIEVSEIVTSEPFPQNTSETETIERTISFTYLGVTATTTIIQGVWINKSYTLDLNDGQWELSGTPVNPDPSLYDGVYRSVKSKGVNSGCDTMYIDIVGYETFKLYIRSYAENNFDYVMVSQLDETITGLTSDTNTTLVKASTKGKSNSSTAISGYTLVEFTGIDEDAHRITIVYRKDSGGNSNDDRGYVLIPKEQ